MSHSVVHKNGQLSLSTTRTLEKKITETELFSPRKVNYINENSPGRIRVKELLIEVEGVRRNE